MVLTTLHTNSTIASITRLLDMGVKAYLIASAIEGIIAQRLVRRICRHCASPKPADGNLARVLNLSPGSLPEELPIGAGCSRCNQTGYLGRLGIFETFVMNDDYRHFISSAYKEAELMAMARASGMTTLLDDGVEKVRSGETTLDEVVRVLGAQTRAERQCGQCRRMVEAKYRYCPFCGTFRKDICVSCNTLLDPTWVACPECGKAQTKEAEN
jgi:type II secretory ATPase GspE/PulE/Tfp pilus assembly ATPase PilB-like protein/RNA polymerase subunit RPABC4/transcription elongation factor Spt4